MMISTAIKSMLKEADNEGCLIPLSSLNDNSGKLSLLSVIVKIRPRKEWFWQKPKYRSRGFTLSDVLEPGVAEDPPLTPSFKNTDFVDYKGIFGDKMKADGTVDGLVASFNFNLGVDCCYERETSFGRLKKEEVEVKKIVQHSKDKLLNMTHPWIRQACAKPRAVLCILTERIMTTDACHFKFNVKKIGDIGAKECLPSNPSTTVKTSMSQKVHKEKDGKVDLKIPEHTVIAFGVIELKVQRNGKFVLCLLSNKGGFEKESDTGFEHDAVMGANNPLNLSNELEKLSDHFQLLSVLPTETRSNLLQLLRNTMKNREEVSVLESVLDQMCDGETPDLGDLRESVRKTVQAVVDLVDQIVGDDKEFRSSLLSAVHLIVSAMDEMTDAGLSELESCCSPPVLEALQILVQCVAAGSGETLSLTDAGLTVLTEEEVYGKAQSLFDLSNVILKREEDTLKTEMKDQPGNLPLVMSIAVKGLASLV
ncbi:gasdermin-E-like isoform X1 [Esox lucius]|uniref:Gasdermin pore forming domain-containing protein n=1 Tax=Esox lucius TaxID=8010 RepID=A0A3P8ZDW5_ESOLU|nr:gasdermin-E-like isoform X1 [Esox lucius]